MVRYRVKYPRGLLLVLRAKYRTYIVLGTMKSRTTGSPMGSRGSMVGEIDTGPYKLNHRQVPPLARFYRVGTSYKDSHLDTSEQSRGLRHDGHHNDIFACDQTLPSVCSVPCIAFPSSPITRVRFAFDHICSSEATKTILCPVWSCGTILCLFLFLFLEAAF